MTPIASGNGEEGIRSRELGTEDPTFGFVAKRTSEKVQDQRFTSVDRTQCTHTEATWYGAGDGL